MARPGYDSPAGSAPSARSLPARFPDRWCPACRVTVHVVICPMCYGDVRPVWVTVEPRDHEWEGR